jgi:outer membrane protein assembly factor BamB
MSRQVDIVPTGGKDLLMKRVVLPFAAIVGMGFLIMNAGAARVEIAWQETNNFESVDFNGLNTPIVKVHSDAHIYLAAVAGRIEGTSGIWDYVVVKRDGRGRLIWQAQLATGVQASVSALVLDKAGNAYVTGYGGTAKFNAADGQIAWSIPPGNSQNGAETFYDIGVDSAGNVYITGHALLDPNSPTSLPLTTIKYDPNGKWLWTRHYPDGVAYSHLRVDESDHVYVAGEVRDPFAVYDDFVIIKYDGNGDQIWTRRYDSSGFDRVTDMAFDKAGNLLVTGPGSEQVTLKYDPDGNLLWEARQPAVGLTSTMALDQSGNIYVRGWYYDEETSFHSLLKLDAHGRHQWTIELTSDFGWGHAFAVDKQGNAYLGVKFSVLKFDRRGNQVLTIPILHEPSTMDVDPAGALLVGTALTTTKIITK